VIGFLLRKLHGLKPTQSMCQTISMPYEQTYIQLRYQLMIFCTPCGARVPLSCLFPPLSIHFLIFCSFLLFPFFLFSLYKHGCMFSLLGRNALHCSLRYNFNVVNIFGLKFDAGKLVLNHYLCNRLSASVVKSKCVERHVIV